VRRQLGDLLAELLEIRASSRRDLVTFLVHRFAHVHLTPPLIPLTTYMNRLDSEHRPAKLPRQSL
jgi:hypothetical protein